jgi:hypothetical protein
MKNSNHNAPCRHSHYANAVEDGSHWSNRSVQFNYPQYVTHDGAMIYQLILVVEFAFEDMEEAYKTFGAAAQYKALKVLVTM